MTRAFGLSWLAASLAALSTLAWAQAPEVRGLSPAQVEQRLGAPAERRAPVGTPPISRWVYADFTVYFEGQHALHAVGHQGLPRRPALNVGTGATAAPVPFTALADDSGLPPLTPLEPAAVQASPAEAAPAAPVDPDPTPSVPATASEPTPAPARDMAVPEEGRASAYRYNLSTGRLEAVVAD